MEAMRGTMLCGWVVLRGGGNNAEVLPEEAGQNEATHLIKRIKKIMMLVINERGIGYFKVLLMFSGY